MNKYPSPAVLYGTVLKCETKLTNNGKQYKSITLSLYCGKNQDGTYKANTYINVMYFGNKTFTIKGRYTFSGNLETKLVERDGKNYVNNILLSFDKDENTSIPVSNAVDVQF